MVLVPIFSSARETLAMDSVGVAAWANTGSHMNSHTMKVSPPY